MSNDRPRLPLRLAGVLCVFLALSVMAGCSAPAGTVSGTVLFGNKPVTGGLITFEPKAGEGNGATSYIDEQGHYEVTLPAGEYLIAVDNKELEARGRKVAPPTTVPPGIKVPAAPQPPANPDAIKESGAAPSTGMTGKYVAFPTKYYRTDTSGLFYNVIAGPQDHNVELK